MAHTFDVEGFNHFQAWRDQKSLRILPSLVCRLDQMRDSFRKHFLKTMFDQISTKVQSMTRRTYQMLLEAVTFEVTYKFESLILMWSDLKTNQYMHT